MERRVSVPAPESQKKARFIICVMRSDTGAAAAAFQPVLKVSGRNREAFGFGFPLEKETVFLVGLQAEVGGGGEDAIE